MKRVIFIFMVLLPLFIGCDPMGFVNTMGELPQFNSLDEANIWIHESITYVEDSDFDLGPNENWKLPDQTLADSSGDCEDMAALLAFVAEHQFHEEGRLVALRYSETGMGHMVAYVNGTYFDPNRNFVTQDLEADYPGFVLEESWSLEDYCRIAVYSPYRSIAETP